MRIQISLAHVNVVYTTKRKREEKVWCSLTVAIYTILLSGGPFPRIALTYVVWNVEVPCT